MQNGGNVRKEKDRKPNNEIEHLFLLTPSVALSVSLSHTHINTEQM